MIGPLLARPGVVELLAVLQSSDSGDGDLFIMLVIGFFLGLYLVYDGFGTWKTLRLIQDTPTEKVRSMAVGRTELEGHVRECEETVTPPYIDEECVYVSWKAERREKKKDDDGNTRYTWKTTGKGSEALRFDLEDETGRVLVRADCDEPEFEVLTDDYQTTVTYNRGESPPAEVSEYIDKFHQRAEADEEDPDGLVGSALDSATDLLGNDDPLGNTRKRRRYHQTILPVDTDAYVFGSAEPKQEASMDAGQEDLLEIRRDDGSGEFLIADSGEDTLQDRYSSMAPAKTIGGLALSAITLYFLLSGYIVA